MSKTIKFDLTEIAYHEAGHAVVGYLFYPPVSVDIIPGISESGYKHLGTTKCDICSAIFFDPPTNEIFFRLYLQVFLYCWSGEYFQRYYAKEIDENGLKVDREFLELTFNDNKILQSFAFYKSEILSTFFENEIIIQMVKKIVDDLLLKKNLTHNEINLLLSAYKFDKFKQIEIIVDKYYDKICNKYNEL